MKIQTSAYEVGSRFIGQAEVEGAMSNPLILAMLRLDNRWPKDDSVPWCSGFVNLVAFILGLPRSKSLSARSWLRVGEPISLADARQENDVVILTRGSGNQPGPEVLEAPGHVGFFAGREPGKVKLLGGNQSDSVSEQFYSASRVIGVRRLA